MNTEQKIDKVLGALESEIMEIVWQSQHPISVRDVTEILQQTKKIAYTTVMTIMGRLTEKGLLKCQTSGRAYIYQPVYSKDKFLTRITHQIIKNFISRFGDIAIAHFAEEVGRLNPHKRKNLLKILKEAKKNES